jgi:DNA-binding SARP family transcriptional activator
VARLTLTLLGNFQARVDDGPALRLSLKTRALLTYLALPAGRAYSRQALTGLLWPDADEAHARQSLRQALFGLRRRLGRARDVLVETETVALRASGVKVDAANLERLAARDTLAALVEAARLYGGDLLGGRGVGEAAFDEWLLVERERLRGIAIKALSKLLARQSQADTVEPAVQTAVRLLGLDPLQERAHRTLMRLYDRSGRRAAALRQYQVCVELLRRELRVEPERETRELYERIVRQPDARTPGPASPRRGPRTGRARAAPALETPMVGRAAEAARLAEALDRATHGQGRALLVVGEAGIGKSRLVEHLVAAAERRGGRVLLARCHETEQILPFRPWVDALRQGAVVDEIDALDTAEPLWRTELSRLFPELGTPGVVAANHEDYVRLFEATARLLGRAASRRPLVLVFEDLQWADDMTVRLIAFLGRRLERSALLLIGTAREEDLAGASVLRTALAELARDDPGATITLAPLSASETTTLVTSLVPVGSSTATIERMAHRVWTVSEGNPFVIVETMRGLQERGTPGGDATIPLPPRVRDVTAARLARLGEAAHRVCAAAAVIGEACGFPLLAEAAGLSHPATAAAVEELVRQRVLAAMGERFHFVHERVREVAYDRLLEPARRSLHAAVARATERLEADHLDEAYDRLAHHCARADEPLRAIGYLVQFAEKARQRYAFDDAARSLDRAHGMVDRLPAAERDRHRIDIAVRQGWVLSMLGRFQPILDLLLPLAERVEALGDPTLAGPYHFRLGLTHTYLGRHVAGAAAAVRAIEQARRCGDDVTLGQALYVLALTSAFEARPVEGMRQARQSVQALDRAGRRDWLGLAYWILGAHHLLLGQFQDALDAEARATAIADEIGDARLQSLSAAYVCWIHLTWGEHELAIAAGRRALQLARDRISEIGASYYLAYALLKKGDVDEAVTLLERAVGEYRTRGLRQPAGRVLMFLAEAYLQTGDRSRARACARECLALTREVTSRWGVAWAERVLGRTAQAEGDLAGAQQHLRDALAGFTDVPAPFEVARTHLDLSALAQAGGDSATAARHAADALKMFVDLRAPRYVARAERLVRELS